MKKEKGKDIIEFIIIDLFLVASTIALFFALSQFVTKATGNQETSAGVVSCCSCNERDTTNEQQNA